MSVEIPSDDSFGLNDSLSTEDNVLCAVNLGPARDLVSRVLVRVNLGSFPALCVLNQGGEDISVSQGKCHVRSQCIHPLQLWGAF